jgi:glutaredoxin
MHEPDRSPGTAASTQPSLVLYTRPGCHLCDDARSILESLLAERHERGLAVPLVEERNIESDETWMRAYLTTIPVVELGEHRLELALSVAKLRLLLANALDGAPAGTTA